MQLLPTGVLAFLFGISIFLQFPTVPSMWVLIFFIPALLFFFALARVQSHDINIWSLVRTYSCVITCAIICGFLWALLRADFIFSQELDRNIEGETVIVTGEVISLPEILDSGFRFEFRVDAMRSETGLVLKSPGNVRLAWYQTLAEIKPGEDWQFHVRLKQPYGFSNPGGFDYEAWLFQHRIRATGYVRNSEQNRLIHQTSVFSTNYLRYSLRKLIHQLDIGDFEKSLLLGLSLGDRSHISVAQWRTLTATGTSHLLAISGLHVGLVAGLCFIIGRWLWSSSSVLLLQLAAHRFAVLSGLSGAFLYAALAGFAIPTQRALIMLAVWMLSRLFYRNYTSSDVISLSLLVVLVLDPFAVVDAGFCLSFMAVSIIAFGMTCRIHKNDSWWQNRWRQWGRIQYLVAMGLLPLLILWFQQYPLLGIFANIVAVPYVSLIVVPLVLLGVIFLIFIFPVGEFVLQLAAKALALIWPLLDYLSDLEFNLWYIASPSLAAFFLAVLGVLIILLPQAVPARWIGFFCLLPLLFPDVEKPEPGGFWLTQLDVGQGLAAVIQTQNHVLIYDTGDRYSERFNAGRAVIIPFLRHQGIQQPDLMVISHGDRDHIGGSKDILADHPMTRVLTSAGEKIKHPLLDICVAGQRWHWDGVDFEILHPAPSALSRINFQGNNNSCVLKVSNQQYSVLLTGDIEHQAEFSLVNSSWEKLSATVLIAPHHGSKTSSSSAFIDAVSPEVVVFPVGYRNRFGFPKQAIISRYESRQVSMFNTARDGAILFKVGISEILISQYRQQNRRFWTSEY